MDYDIFIYRGHEGDWKWNDNKDSFVYQHWEDGEPDGGEAENCTGLAAEAETEFWAFDVDCDQKRTPTCQGLGGPRAPGTPVHLPVLRIRRNNLVIHIY